MFNFAHVAELADAYASGAYGVTRGGSNPLVSTFRSWRWDGGSGKFPNIFHHAGGFEQFDHHARQRNSYNGEADIVEPREDGIILS